MSKVPESSRSRVKKEIGDFIVTEILSQLQDGDSPVVGESFPTLNKQYAKDEKGGDRTPNLDLDGDMLNALTFKNTDDGIKVGIFKSSELGKADGHNKFSRSNNNRIPQRRFIPKPSQSFDPEIRREVKRIIKENESEGRISRPSENGEFRQTITDFSTVTTTEVTVSDVFDDFLVDFFREK